MTDSITTKIHQWVLQQFPAAAKHNISFSDSLLDSGIVDSMGTLEIVEYLENEFGLEVSDEDMVADHFESVESIATYVNHQTALDASRRASPLPSAPSNDVGPVS